MAGAILAASLAPVAGEDTKPEAAKPAKDPASEKQVAKKPAKKKLTGAEIYAINCNRCHPERYATEFTASQWKSIMLHMRVRANLPADQAKAVLKYLQEDSGKP
jgi:mono/diheme cytochrome c family protein